MAEGIRFNSESFDDDDMSAESNKDKKKKKKKAGNVGKAIVDGMVDGKPSMPEKSTTASKQNFLDLLKGWLTDETPKEASIEKASRPVEIVAASDIETLSVAPSSDEEAAIQRAKEILSPNALGQSSAETLEPTIFENFRTQLSPDELSGGEGIINLQSGDAETASEQEIFQRSVEDDLSLIETVDSDDEAGAVQRAPQVLRRTPVGAQRRRGHTAASRPSSTGYVPLPGAGSVGGIGQNRANTAPNVPVSSLGTLLAQRLAFETAHLAGRTRGFVEGALTGALIAGGIEHSRHSRREKAESKKLKNEQQKQAKALETTQFHTADLVKEHEAAIRTVTQERREHEERLHADAEAVISARTSEVVATTKALAAEKAKADSEKEKAKLIERLNAQAAEQERLATEALLKDPDHHIETSAWHTMEVDKSGHIVQDSALEYGHEYYRERAHETGPKEQFDIKAGTTAVAAAMLSEDSSHAQVGAAAPTFALSSTPIQSSDVQQPGLPPIVSPTTSSDATPSPSFVSFVPWLILLAAIVVTLLLLLF